MTVKIKSAKNVEYMTARSGVVNDSLIYCEPSDKPALEFELQGTIENCTLRVVNTDQELYLSYRNATGAVKLFKNAQDADWHLTRDGAVYWIKNLTHNQFMWLDGNEPTVNHSGNPKDLVAQWLIEGL